MDISVCWLQNRKASKPPLGIDHPRVPPAGQVGRGVTGGQQGMRHTPVGGGGEVLLSKQKALRLLYSVSSIVVLFPASKRGKSTSKLFIQTTWGGPLRADC